MEKVEYARKFCQEVRALAEAYQLPFFVVTDGASATSNNGCDAVRHAREQQILWERQNGFDPNEDWSKDTIHLVPSTLDDIELLKRHKKESVLTYAKNLTEAEKTQIERYIEEIPKQIGLSKIIKRDRETIGSFFTRPYENGVLIDELYLEEKWRNKGIGTQLIKSVISKNEDVYLFVYAKNEKAILLYKRLGFKVVKEQGEKFLMKYEDDVLTVFTATKEGK